MDKKKTNYSGLAALSFVAAAIIIWYYWSSVPVPIQEPAANTPSNQPAVNPANDFPATTSPTSTEAIPADKVEYRNDQYGFKITLPLSWQGYRIMTEKWQGNMVDDPQAAAISGPKLLIRHPLWTEAVPRQDIPVMVFTPAQWELIQRELLAVSAAPIGPSELGRNKNYVFALPARYNYAFPAGFEEVEQILAAKPFQAF